MVGHIRLAFALHELKRTQEAFDALLPVADKFPELWVIPYNLACYTCRPDLVGFVNGLPLVVIELRSCLESDSDLPRR